MSAELIGMDKLTKGFNDALKKMSTVNAKAFTDIVLDLTGKAVDLAPIDLGDLRGSASASIEGTIVAKGSSEGGISICGTAPEGQVLNAVVGFSEPYAIKQHEHTEYKHPQGGEAKYLEKPFRNNINKYIKHIADSNQDALK